MYKIYKRLLDERGVSTADVCKATGISQSTMSNWKKRNNMISPANAKKIAEYFGVTVDYLMYGEMHTSEEGVQKNEHHEEYYIDREAREMAQFLAENPEYKVLFDASRKVKPKDVEFVREFIERMTGGE